MISSEEIKKLLTPTMVIEHYLGQPQKRSGDNLIYKSPFRNERTASFWVSDTKGIHDFGTSIHYDIISFLQEWLKTDFKTAINKLCYDFQISNCEPVSEELKVYLIQQRQDEIQIYKNIDSWFYRTFNKLCDELNIWQKAIPHLKGEALAIAYNKEQYLDYLTDLFVNANEDEKIELWKDKEGIEKCLRK